MLGSHTLQWFDTPHVPHGWECGLLMDQSTGTFFCGDLFTAGPGHGEQALTEADILTPSEAFRRGMDYYAHAPHTAQRLRRLAQQGRARWLACMAAPGAATAARCCGIWPNRWPPLVDRRRFLQPLGPASDALVLPRTVQTAALSSRRGQSRPGQPFMVTPITVSIAHQLGRAEARRRIEAGFAKFVGHFPGGGIRSERWDGDRLSFSVVALGQTVSGALDVSDTAVRIEYRSARASRHVCWPAQ